MHTVLEALLGLLQPLLSVISSPGVVLWASIFIGVPSKVDLLPDVYYRVLYMKEANPSTIHYEG